MFIPESISNATNFLSREMKKLQTRPRTFIDFLNSLGQRIFPNSPDNLRVTEKSLKMIRH